MRTVFIIKHEHGLDALLESYGKAYVGKQVLKLSFFYMQSEFRTASE